MSGKSSISLTIIVAWLSAFAFAQGLETTASKDDWEEVNFEFNSAILSDGYPSLLRLADLLAKNPSYRVKLEGNTDWVGSEKYNEKLGMARAATVKSFLVKYGAHDEQVEALTRGKKAPKVDNKSKEGRFMNRRVVMIVTDGEGRTVSAGGIGDAIRALQEMEARLAKKQTECCAEILKRLDRLDDILAALKDLKGENAGLKKELDNLKQEHADLRQKVEGLPKPLGRPEVAEITRSSAAEAIEQARMPRFSLLGLNVGPDSEGRLTFSGKGRYFAPFKDNFAVQAQGEYLYFRDRQEGQFDIGLVNRIKNFQGGLFSSFKHVNVREFGAGGTLGQAAATFDYLFKQGRVGIFGTKGFLDNAVLNRVMLSRNVFLENYLKIVDQAGASTALGLYGNAYMEANLGYLKARGGDDKPGGTIRFVHPISDRWAFTLEGGFNETLIGRDHSGRVVAGIQYGNLLRPKEFVDLKHPVPVDVPRVRYELLSRRVRTGNDPPVADAGIDQIGVAAGAITLDGSGSYDPDGDPITFEWTQIAGQAVALAGKNVAKASFQAGEGQQYGFRLTVKDDKGAQGTARVTVTTTAAQAVQIVKYFANPVAIRAGQPSTIVWQVLNADEVTISGIGRVDPRAGSSSVSPNETTMYRLTARNKTSEANETLTITVERPEVRILSFLASPTNIMAGEVSTLSWRTENADQVTISELGNVERSGSAPVSPTETTTYRLTARNRYGEVSATATVQVTPGQAPRVLRFTATPTEIVPPEQSTLAWQVENADEVTITSLGKVALTGNSNVAPTQTTTYTLVARNRFGETSSTTTVTVTPAATIGSCQATPSTSAKPGDPVMLSWVAQNATEVTVSGVGSAPVPGPLTVRPTVDTSYTITAIGRRSQASCQVSVKVTPTTPVTPPPAVKAPVVVIAGAPVIETIVRTVRLDASGSSNPDGGALTYSWRSLDTRSAVLDPSSPTPIVQLGNMFGDYVFEVTVTNNKGVSTVGTVTVRLVVTRVQ